MHKAMKEAIKKKSYVPILKEVYVALKHCLNDDRQLWGCKTCGRKFKTSKALEKHLNN